MWIKTVAFVLLKYRSFFVALCVSFIFPAYDESIAKSELVPVWYVFWLISLVSCAPCFDACAFCSFMFCFVVLCFWGQLMRQELSTLSAQKQEIEKLLADTESKLQLL